MEYWWMKYLAELEAKTKKVNKNTYKNSVYSVALGHSPLAAVGHSADGYVVRGTFLEWPDHLMGYIGYQGRQTHYRDQAT